MCDLLLLNCIPQAYQLLAFSYLSFLLLKHLVDITTYTVHYSSSQTIELHGCANVLIKYKLNIIIILVIICFSMFPQVAHFIN